MATVDVGNKTHTGTAPGQLNRFWGGVPFTIPKTGTLTAAKVYVATVGASAKGKILVYSSVLTLPNTLRAASAGFALSGTAGFKGPASMSLSVTTGDLVCLGVVCGGTGYPAFGVSYPTGFHLIRKDAGTMSYASPPSTFPTADGNDVNQCLTIYATITYGGGTTVTLTGNSAASAAGSFSLKSQRTVAGNAARGYSGALAPRLAKVAAGLAATAGAGVFMPRTAPVLAGDASAALVGAPRPNLRATVSGVSSTSAEGAFSPAKAMTLVGVYATGANGSPVPRTAVTISGNAVAATEGATLPAARPTLSGVATTSASGRFAPAIKATLFGLHVSGLVGTLAPPDTVTVAIDGVQAATDLGVLSPQLRRTLAGVVAAGRAGQFAFGPQPPAHLVSFTSENIGSASTLTVQNDGSQATLAIRNDGSQGRIAENL